MTVSVIPVMGVPDVQPGDDLAGILTNCLAPIDLQTGDVLVVTHKVVSKAEGAVLDTPTDADYRRAVETEAAAILRRRGDLTIAETRHGFICANAGLDRSNVKSGRSVRLPEAPDRSAHRLRDRIMHAFGVEVAVIVTDTFGRPWRRGLTDVAIGVAGIRPITDLKGSTDMYGRVLEVTEIAVVDEIAAAADLVMGKARGIPAAVVRGVAYEPGPGSIEDLIRPPSEDLFR
jgi:coenzyme F420-0:L-glutamate ligase/coenzyme F420-1:gamma-L-glutamate ligase